MKTTEIRCCVICSIYKKAPRLHGQGDIMLLPGEFKVITTSKRKTCSTKCSRQYRLHRQRRSASK